MREVLLAKYVFGELTLGDVLSWAQPDSATVCSETWGGVHVPCDSVGIAYKGVSGLYPIPLSTKITVRPDRIEFPEMNIHCLLFRGNERVFFDDIMPGTHIDRIHGGEQREMRGFD